MGLFSRRKLIVLHCHWDCNGLKQSTVGCIDGKNATVLCTKSFMVNLLMLTTRLQTNGEILPSVVEGWSPENVYNCDETGLYYRAIPDGTYTTKGEKVSGGKKSKNRLTVLLCCNSEGSHKLPPLVISTSKNPRSFKNVSQLPVPYKANSSAWMTGELFSNWLIGVD